MSEANILSQLNPCPFCGAGHTEADTNPIAANRVRIRHWCPRQPGCVSQHVEVRGRDAASAISQWNARAGGGE